MDVVTEAGATDAQSLTDIQSYLANFNKEIGTDTNGSTILFTPAVDAAAVQNVSMATTFATPEQLFTNASVSTIESSQASIEQQLSTEPSAGATMVLQGPDGQPIQVLASAAALTVPQPIATISSNTELLASQTSSQPQLIAVQQQQQQTVSEQQQQQQQQQQQKADVEQQQQHQHQSVVLNTGNSYQTVTIVPSEVNQGGEVSYVLIVSQPDDGKNADMSVYDFKEEKGMVDSGDEETDDNADGKLSKLTQRKMPGVVHTQLMCNYCNYTSPKRYLLMRHMKTHSEERPHKCHICDRGFKTVASLQNHINTHTGVRPHKCKECDAAFTTSGELVRHVRYRHTFEKPHKCSECDYSSVELSKLKRHVRSHTGERPYQCPHCSYASPDTYKLKRHLRIHTGEKPYKCDVCHARFTQSNSLKTHRLIHTGSKPIFQCELCPTTCGRKTDLKIHVQKLHTTDVPLQCKKCGKSFPDRYTYKIHMKSHEGEKCFRCELCPYAALSQRHLESHILTHTGEKPFECDECDQTFRQKQLLKRHKNLYHTPDYIAPAPKDKMHECGECHKTFAHKGNLLRHMIIHDPDNPIFQENLIVKDEGMVIERVVSENGTHLEGEGGSGQTISYIQDADGNYVQLVSPDGAQTGQIFVQIDGNQQTIAVRDHHLAEKVDDEIDDESAMETEQEEDEIKHEMVAQPMQLSGQQIVTATGQIVQLVEQPVEQPSSPQQKSPRKPKTTQDDTSDSISFVVEAPQQTTDIIS